MQKDKLTIKAKSEGYNARSVYKLFEINKRYNLIKKNDLVLDLGCWPGSWLQACLEIDAKPVGVDLRETKINGAETLVADVNEDEIFLLLKNKKFDVVLSDLAPHTSGHREQDQYLSYELSCRAFDIAKKVLKSNGNFLVKIFQSEEAGELLKELRKSFNFVKSVKPDASKKRSKEIYFLCLGYRG